MNNPERIFDELDDLAFTLPRLNPKNINIIVITTNDIRHCISIKAMPSSKSKTFLNVNLAGVEVTTLTE